MLRLSRLRQKVPQTKRRCYIQGSISAECVCEWQNGNWLHDGETREDEAEVEIADARSASSSRSHGSEEEIFTGSWKSIFVSVIVVPNAGDDQMLPFRPLHRDYHHVRVSILREIHQGVLTESACVASGA
jgi:hypothetical protein